LKDPETGRATRRRTPTGDVGVRLALNGTLLLWLIVFVVLPLGSVLANAFWKMEGAFVVKDLSLTSFSTILENPVYRKVLFRTLTNALLVALVAVALAYPLAYLVSRETSRVRNRLVVLVLLPLWMGYLMRIFAWQILLGRQGIVNSVLIWLGVIDQPINGLLYGPISVWIALVQISIPFVFVPIYLSLERIPNGIIESSRDLGASPRKSFTHIVLPLSAPGIAIGFVFAFIQAFGDYVTPTLLGGSQGILIGRVIVSQFGIAYNPPLGAALGLIVLVVTVVSVAIVLRLGAREAVLE
jgi:spermidine/putrescine transport system permease protein